MTPFRKKFYTIASFLLILIIGLITAWVLMFIAIYSASREVADVALARLVEQYRTERARILARSTKEAQVLGDELDHYFLREEDAVAFLERIEQLSAHAGVTIEPSGLAKTESGELVLSISLHGTYASALYFVSLLEHTPYYLVVQNLRLNVETPTDPKKKTAPIWGGNLTLVVRSFLPEVIATKP